ncbi:MAG: hypothetical protein WC712_10645 [Candidatus Brocadiia bacterium]
MKFLRLIQFALILLMLFWFTVMLIGGNGEGQSMDPGLLILEGIIAGLVSAIVTRKIIESGSSPSLAKFAVAMVSVVLLFGLGWAGFTLLIGMHQNPDPEFTYFWRTMYAGYGCFVGWFLVIMAATLGRLLRTKPAVSEDEETEDEETEDEETKDESDK